MKKQGAPSPIQHLKDELKQELKHEEESYGHELDSEDILDMWKEKISKHYVDLLALKKQTELSKQQELAASRNLSSCRGSIFYYGNLEPSLRKCLDSCREANFAVGNFNFEYLLKSPH